MQIYDPNQLASGVTTSAVTTFAIHRSGAPRPLLLLGLIPGLAAAYGASRPPLEGRAHSYPRWWTSLLRGDILNALSPTVGYTLLAIITPLRLVNSFLYEVGEVGRALSTAPEVFEFPRKRELAVAGVGSLAMGLRARDWKGAVLCLLPAVTVGVVGIWEGATRSGEIIEFCSRHGLPYKAVSDAYNGFGAKVESAAWSAGDQLVRQGAKDIKDRLYPGYLDQAGLRLGQPRLFQAQMAYQKAVREDSENVAQLRVELFAQTYALLEIKVDAEAKLALATNAHQMSDWELACLGEFESASTMSDIHRLVRIVGNKAGGAFAIPYRGAYDAYRFSADCFSAADPEGWGDMPTTALAFGIALGDQADFPQRIVSLVAKAAESDAHLLGQMFGIPASFFPEGLTIDPYARGIQNLCDEAAGRALEALLDTDGLKSTIKEKALWFELQANATLYLAQRNFILSFEASEFEQDMCRLELYDEVHWSQETGYPSLQVPDGVTNIAGLDDTALNKWEYQWAHWGSTRNTFERQQAVRFRREVAPRITLA